MVPRITLIVRGEVLHSQQLRSFMDTPQAKIKTSMLAFSALISRQHHPGLETRSHRLSRVAQCRSMGRVVSPPDCSLVSLLFRALRPPMASSPTRHTLSLLPLVRYLTLLSARSWQHHYTQHRHPQLHPLHGHISPPSLDAGKTAHCFECVPKINVLKSLWSSRGKGTGG